MQLLRSLAFLHAQGVWHCDLKPSNIAFKDVASCDVKVIDLGSACFAGDKPEDYVQTRDYRSPEALLGAPYGSKIDLWSLGCILAELAIGSVLFKVRRVWPRLFCCARAALPCAIAPLNQGGRQLALLTSLFLDAFPTARLPMRLPSCKGKRYPRKEN